MAVHRVVLHRAFMLAVAKTDLLSIVYSFVIGRLSRVFHPAVSYHSSFLIHSEQKVSFENRAYTAAVRWHWHYLRCVYYVYGTYANDSRRSACGLQSFSPLVSGPCVIQNVGQRLDG